MQYTEKDAMISDCGKYRYFLSRRWGTDEDNDNLLVFVGLNPSKADAMVDDPTIRRCVDFAKSFGYQGIVMLNLFAYRATDPKELCTVENATGPVNTSFITDLAKLSPTMVICCGGRPPGLPRALFDAALSFIMSIVQEPMCFGTTKDGYPRHPLFLRKDTQLIPFQFKPKSHASN
jgi:hypothetical protein